jgi:hypothetical protein
MKVIFKRMSELDYLGVEQYGFSLSGQADNGYSVNKKGASEKRLPSIQGPILLE